MTGFGDCFTESQRAALAALGYVMLERFDAAAAAEHDRLRAAAANEDAPAGAADRPGAGKGSGPGLKPARRDAPRTTRRAGAGPLPASVLLVGMDPGDPLARAIELVLGTCIEPGDPRVSRGGGALEIATGGPGPQWRVHLDQLRGSARHKAALWRALRTLPRGNRR